MKPISAIILAILPALSSAAITTNFNAGVFDITTNAGDSVTLAIASGNLKINGNDPTGGPRPIADIGLLRVNGDNLANNFDLSAITPASTGLAVLAIELTGLGGTDTLTGSDFSDKIIGGAGADIIDGRGNDDRFEMIYGNGNDIFTGGDGDDTLTIFGTGNSDKMNFTNNAGIPVLLDDDNIVYRVEFQSLEEISLFAGGGDDTVIVGDMLANGPQMFRFDGQAGTNTLNSTTFLGDIEVLRNPGSSSDTIRASSSMLNDNIILNSLNNSPTTYQLQQLVTSTGLVIFDATNFGQLQIFNIDSMVINGSDQNDDIQANIINTSLKSIVINARGGNDEILTGHSPKFTLELNGGSGNDTLTFNARNTNATDSGTQILIPAQPAVDYTSIETVILQNATATPKDYFIIY